MSQAPMPKKSKTAKPDGAGRSPIPRARLRTAQSRLGYKFKDESLLAQALCHASVRNEGLQDNERLEFLGDAILNMLVSWLLYDGMVNADEGTLSHRRSRMTEGPHLAMVSNRLKLGELLRTGKGQDIAPTPNMEADLIEACIGAIFLDGGLDAAQDFVLHQIIADYKPDDQIYNDPKSRLQHYALEHRLGLPEYGLADTSGPGHSLTFTMEVTVGGKQCGRGTGSSKKIAAQFAAGEALKSLAADEPQAEQVAEKVAESDQPATTTKTKKKVRGARRKKKR